MKNSKIITFYLPQFHQIKENDDWWGKGYTEWVKVKKAKKYFNWQDQPKVPLDNNYYDLSESTILENQSELALRHGIDGFCYYHYWFKGTKLLEKPIEMMLDNKNIKIPFCLSWANHKWTRIWDGDSDECLMPMLYGEVSDWEVHIKYLMNYFNDDRYIKINNRPVFLIYQTSDFNNFDNMIDVWNSILSKNGIGDIYIIETFNFFQNKSNCTKSEGVVLFEPMYTLSHDNNIFERLELFISRKFKSKYSPQTYRFDKIWDKILNRELPKINKEIYMCAFPNWDNTSRKNVRGIVFKGSKPSIFKKYFTKLLYKSNQNNADFVFINAWNEWSEGAYLEPDEINRYSFLEAIKESKNNYLNK